MGERLAELRQRGTQRLQTIRDATRRILAEFPDHAAMTFTTLTTLVATYGMAETKNPLWVAIGGGIVLLTYQADRAKRQIDNQEIFEAGKREGQAAAAEEMGLIPQILFAKVVDAGKDRGRSVYTSLDGRDVVHTTEALEKRFEYPSETRSEIEKILSFAADGTISLQNLERLRMTLALLVSDPEKIYQIFPIGTHNLLIGMIKVIHDTEEQYKSD